MNALAFRRSQREQSLEHVDPKNFLGTATNHVKIVPNKFRTYYGNPKQNKCRYCDNKEVSGKNGHMCLEKVDLHKIAFMRPVKISDMPNEAQTKISLDAPATYLHLAFCWHVTTIKSCHFDSFEKVTIYIYQYNRGPYTILRAAAKIYCSLLQVPYSKFKIYSLLQLKF